MAKQSKSVPRLDLNHPNFDKLVAHALEHLWEFSYLGKSPLTQLKIVEQSLPQEKNWSHVDRGGALNRILHAAIENLKPMEQYPSFSREVHYYSILHQAYIEGVENKVIAHNLNLSLRSLYRRRTEALRIVAQILRDWEKQSAR